MALQTDELVPRMEHHPRPPRFIATALLAAGALACGAREAAPETFAETFDRVWSTVDVTYPYFDLKGIDWPAQLGTYRPQAVAAPSEKEFREVVRAMLGELHDEHVHLQSSTGQYLPTYQPVVARNWSESSWSAALSRHAIAATAGAVRAGRIGSVGYLAIRTWNTGSVSAAMVDAALDPLLDTSALVIDVRMNGGGNDGIAYEVAGRFATASTIGSFVRFRSGPGHGDLGPLFQRLVVPRGRTYRAPVLLLVGAGCMSSCEGFVAAMRALDTVRLAGDPTRGSTGNPREVPLRGDWTFTVSTWIQYTHDMQVIEDHGIAPDVALAWTPDDLAAGEDPVLEGALAFLAQP